VDHENRVARGKVMEIDDESDDESEVLDPEATISKTLELAANSSACPSNLVARTAMLLVSIRSCVSEESKITPEARRLQECETIHY